MFKNIPACLSKLVQAIVIPLSISIIFSFPSLAQDTGNYSHASFAEKIYLQLDSKVYTTDRTIWYKCIIVNAMDHAPNTLSGVLYVELIDPNEKIVANKTIKIENGIGDGFFELDQSYSEGLYLIRAYTEWNKNFESDFFFKEYIHVFATSAKEKAEPISNVTLVEKQNTNHRLTASLNPYVIDSLHEKELTLFITQDDLKDTLTIKRTRDKKYLLDYAISNECQFITLTFQTKNLISYSKTIALNEDHLDLQFFPESGEFVHGLPSKVGLKALDYRGKGKMVDGVIVNEQGEFVTSFKSNQLGMGSFTLTNVDSSEAYFAKLRSQSEGNLSTMYPLPEISPKGNVLAVIEKDNNIRLTVSSNYLNKDSICIRASSRGIIYFDLKGCLKEGVLTLALPAKMLPEGIIAFTLMDNIMQPVAERLFFNERPDGRISIALSSDEDTYSQRELTKLDIRTTKNDGEVLNANLSLLVLNKEQMGKIQSTRQNILSYFLLSSDLKGDIENPGYYFGADTVRFNDLDDLLLTQGWRKYHYTKPLDIFHFQPEPYLSVSGSINGASSKKMKKDIELTMMTFGNSRSVQSQATDSLGRFNFYLNDEYGQDLNIVIQSAKNSGKKKNFTISIDRKESPVVSYDHTKTIEGADNVVYELVEKNIERKIVEDAYVLSSGSIALEEVVIKGYKMTPERKKVASVYGIPDQIITGKSIEEEEMEWSSGLYSVLKQKFPDKITIRTFYTSTGKHIYASVNDDMTLVVIDGILAASNDYPMIPFIPPSEVSSFEIIENPKNFASLFRQTYTRLPPLFAPSTGNIIAIYTHAGKGIAGTTKPVGIIKSNIPVFSPRKEFYSPKYDKLHPDDWYKPDLRALVHWEPKVKVDSLGKASITFYNADNIGEMLVIVEAISEKGELGYQEITYEVKKRIIE